MGKFGSSYDFSITGGRLVTLAFRETGIYDVAEAIETNAMTDGLDKLNMIMKQLMGPNNRLLPGFKIFKEADKSITFSTRKQSYTLMASGGDVAMNDVPVAVKSILRRDTSNNDTPLSPMSFNEYRAISNKQVQTTPTRYYYENGLSAGTLNFDCKVDVLTDTYQMRYLAPFIDADATTALDTTQYFYRVLLYMLAVDLCPGNPVPADKIQLLTNLKNEAIALAQTFEPEDTDIYFEPGKD